MDGHPPRVGLGLPDPTLDDVAASLGARLRKYRRNLRWGGDHPVLGCDVAATALDGLAERVTRLGRTTGARAKSYSGADRR